MRVENYTLGTQLDLLARTHPLLVDYDVLPAEARDAEYDAVSAMLAELRYIYPDQLPPDSAAVTDEDVVRICEAVHDRWIRRKLAKGFRLGAVINEDERSHVDLVPFSKLRAERQRVEAYVVRTVLGAILKTAALQALLSHVTRRGLIWPNHAFLTFQRPSSITISRLDDLRADMNELLPHLGDAAWQEIKRKLRPEHLSAYPELGFLFDSLARWLNVDRSQLTVAAGSDAAIGQILRVFLKECDTVLLPTPTYGMYAVYAQMCGARVLEFPHETDFSLDVKAFFDALVRERPNVVVIAQPNGALGSAIDEHDLGNLIATAERQGTLVILDEAHVAFHRDVWIPAVKAHENLVLVRSFSKSGGLAGLRLGYTISCSWLRDLINRARPVVEITAVTALAAQVLLENPRWIETAVCDVLQGKAWLAQRLEEDGRRVFRGHGNFIQVHAGTGAAQAVVELRNRGIRVRDQQGLELLCSWIRVTCGPQSLSEVLYSALREVLP